MKRLDQRHEVIINVLSAVILKSHPKHISSHLFFDNANAEFWVRDFLAFGEVGDDFRFQLGRVKYIHSPNGIRYRHQTQCNHNHGLGRATQKAVPLLTAVDPKNWTMC